MSIAIFVRAEPTSIVTSQSCRPQLEVNHRSNLLWRQRLRRLLLLLKRRRRRTVRALLLSSDLVPLQRATACQRKATRRERLCGSRQTDRQVGSGASERGRASREQQASGRRCAAGAREQEQPSSSRATGAEQQHLAGQQESFFFFFFFENMQFDSDCLIENLE